MQITTEKKESRNFCCRTSRDLFMMRTHTATPDCLLSLSKFFFFSLKTTMPCQPTRQRFGRLMIYLCAQELWRSLFYILHSLINSSILYNKKRRPKEKLPPLRDEDYLALNDSWLCALPFALDVQNLLCVALKPFWFVISQHRLLIEYERSIRISVSIFRNNSSLSLKTKSIYIFHEIAVEVKRKAERWAGKKSRPLQLYSSSRSMT